MKAISVDKSSFTIPSAPDLIPNGEWKKVDGGVCAAKGFKATGVYAGLRAAGQKADLALVVADKPATAAGTFTTNVMCAAPVTFCKEVLSRSPTVRAVLTNAGQANAATGRQGYEDSVSCATALAKALNLGPDQVLLQSTGVIGRRLKMDNFLAAIPEIPSTLGSTAEDAHRAAVAITTTDLVCKEAALEITIDGVTVRVGGMCKGSGMIHPNMATMLAVLTCDADVETEVWRGIIRRAADNSFNSITVDGDTSTNDCVIGLVSAAAGAPRITAADSPSGRKLEAAVTALLQGLAKSIAWDGEGATCLLEVEVVGADTEKDARIIARSVAGSSLAKSAIFGHDPNWGRLAAAAGYSGIIFNQEDLGVRLGSMQLMEKGQPLPFDKKAANLYLKETCGKHGTVNVVVTVGNGPAKGMAWGCDLSYEYVKINAEYTT
nr:arginine biosynthesis bifunctional (ARGJ) [Polytomella parva]|eukprot:CAMPEP_0175049328 /NCGR_PEP_ID=MMETSP0052_2-20121109/6673_1 /TAXON_ID=51329 ORGANISM="Polytomella parva, Strain SAG 63-3" /NCGR_SAMPLE_ID=MMETSP0052_2 /ASSEMBLY_ACC=CAM_ASM_000194 /LENGTH=434 /DNA_ID=CAMNT_0016313469 /DNA_START=128 /DNA_END=1432 /DNA_ORIENTATION=+